MRAALLLAGLLCGCALSPADEANSPSYPVQVDRERLQSLTAAGRISDFLRLPDGQSLDFHVTGVEGDPPRVWRGRLYGADDAGTGLTLSRSGERLSGGFRWQGESWRLRTRKGEDVLMRGEEVEKPAHGQPRVPEE